MHAKFAGLMLGALFMYASRVPKVQALCLPSCLMTRRSVPQPDACLRRVHSGRSRIEPARKLLAGAPELIAEISYSTRFYDLGSKLALYQSAGVLEYVVVLLEQRRVEWRFLEAGAYRLAKPHRDGTLRSREFPGLWLDTHALWKADGAALLAMIDRGIAACSKAGKRFTSEIARN